MDFGEATELLGSLELNKTLERHLQAFAEVNKHLREQQYRQSEQDLFTLANALDEYIRIIGSIEANHSLIITM